MDGKFKKGQLIPMDVALDEDFQDSEKSFNTASSASDAIYENLISGTRVSSNHSPAR